MKKRLQVFVSSTFSDLADERQAAVAAILKAGHIPAGMELFAAGDESQLETIHRWIDESDVYMLILGGRYGTIEPRTQLSYTELEYDYAVARGKRYFSVVMREETVAKKAASAGNTVVETANPAKLESFRKKVLSRTSAFFADARDISLAVYETLADFQLRHEFHGWVSGADIPDAKILVDRIGQLDEENRLLVEETKALRQQLTSLTSEVDSEASYSSIADIFDRIKIPIPSGVDWGGAKKVALTDVMLAMSGLHSHLSYGQDRSPLSSFFSETVMPVLLLGGLAEVRKDRGMGEDVSLSLRGVRFRTFLDERERQKKRR